LAPEDTSWEKWDDLQHKFHLERTRWPSQRRVMIGMQRPNRPNPLG